MLGGLTHTRDPSRSSSLPLHVPCQIQYPKRDHKSKKDACGWILNRMSAKPCAEACGLNALNLCLWLRVCHGAQSRQARRRLYGRDVLNGRLPVLFEHLPLMHLPLPAKYKHLGTYQAPSGSMVEELKYRAAQARAAYGEARRKMYKAKAVPLTKKAVLLSTTVLPKLLHGAGTWPPLTKKGVQAVRRDCLGALQRHPQRPAGF